MGQREEEEEEEKPLSSSLFKLAHPSQMAVFSCMRLEDVSDSRCCFSGKLIFQAKLFLLRQSAAVVTFCEQSLSLCFGGENRSR